MALRGDKAPGPDGINPLFYQKNWPIMGKDLCHAILDVLNNGANLAPINETFVILIPKKNNDIRVQDFRPTSLCFTIYKVVAMSIAYKLKAITYRKSGKVGWAALKLDMEKTFNKVDCISTVSPKLYINNSLSSHIFPSRGIGKGDPLSPYLFFRVAEGLSTLIPSKTQDHLFKGIFICRLAHSIPHLLFANNSLLFTLVNTQNCKAINDILNIYDKATCQSVNLAKSSCFHCSKKSSFLFLLQKASSKLSVWNQKLFSKACKEVLLKSVLGHVNIGSTLVSQFFFHNKKNCDIKEILLRGFDAFRKDNLAVFFGILWAIWNHRNKFLFADKKHVYMDIEPFIVSYLQDYKVAQAMIILQSDSSTQNQEAAQSRPTSSLSILEQYKLSVDAAIKRQVNKHGYGVVVQDSNDRVIAEIYSSTTSGVPPIFAEVEALL
ncbi:uncharacterized protein LOC115694951 [Cannabis sativa]|uniref:uncharacterized protein LOC115694951 n=1 Tax=Cannabis sativa TaxID=3483 RepID=UPI0011E009E9|nr:uncharacterized protein LOC115694951 [Cannabis sativa]